MLVRRLHVPVLTVAWEHILAVGLDICRVVVCSFSHNKKNVKEWGLQSKKTVALNL